MTELRYVHSDFPFHDLISVHLDGVEQENSKGPGFRMNEASSEKGWIRGYVTNERGRVLEDKTISGDVQILFKNEECREKFMACYIERQYVKDFVL